MCFNIQQLKFNINSFIQGLREKYNKTEFNAEEYLSNPLHSFRLVRRMHADWPKWLDYIKKPIELGTFYNN